MKALNALFRWIETRDAILLFIVLALSAQIPQVAALVLHITGGTDWFTIIHAYAFAVAIEGAILIFVTRGRVGLAWIFAVGGMAMNAAHYLPPVLARHPNLATPAAVMDMGGALLLSVSLPFALAQYSHVAAEGTEKGHDAPPQEQEVPVSDPPAPTDAPLHEGEGSLDTAPTPTTHPCAIDGCPNPALACEHECGAYVCVTHKGTHNQWHCPHNPKSRAYQGALHGASNGHLQGTN